MRVVIAGGSGSLGRSVRRHLETRGHRVVVLTRTPRSAEEVGWDGKTLGPWVSAVDAADGVINFAGRSIQCRHNARNLKVILDFRVASTRILGEAIAAAERPPSKWLQASAATIYSHRCVPPHDEASEALGDGEDAPARWNGARVARAWEQVLDQAETPGTQKVSMRMAMVLDSERGSTFHQLRALVSSGFGGHLGDGRQMVSWIHEHDLVRSIEFILEGDDLSGPVNICAPEPLPNAEFMEILSRTLGARFMIASPVWALEIGAIFLRTETEFLLKSRNVVPAKLQDAGFQFEYPNWAKAAENLSRRLGKS